MPFNSKGGHTSSNNHLANSYSSPYTCTLGLAKSAYVLKVERGIFRLWWRIGQLSPFRTKRLGVESQQARYFFPPNFICWGRAGTPTCTLDSWPAPLNMAFKCSIKDQTLFTSIYNHGRCWFTVVYSTCAYLHIGTCIPL